MRSVVMWLLLAAACDPLPSEPAVSPAAPPPEAPPAASAPAPSAAVAARAVDDSAPPPPDAGQLVALEVEGFEEAVVAVPVQARTPRPLLVATHGNYDGPEWQCREWQRIAGDQVFVLCPRGKPRPDSPSPDDIRFTYANNAALERELDAALAALKARFGDSVDVTAVVYSGFSLGSIMGVKIAARRGDLYPRLALVEGGYDEWTVARAKAFVAAGGKRVLFLCGQKACQIASQRVGKALEDAGVAVRVALSPGLGHSYGGPMTDLARAELPWLVENDPRWPR